MLYFHEGNHGMFIYMLYELNPNSSTLVMNETLLIHRFKVSQTW